MEAKKNKDPEGKNDKTFIKPLNLLGFSEHLDWCPSSATSCHSLVKLL